MKLPTQRLTITPAEYTLLRPGLERLANGLATAKLGNFPDRHALRLGADNGGIYPRRRFDQDMADRIISVRRKLWEIASSRKVRLDMFELAAAAFALRILKPAADNPIDTNSVRSLAQKLETYRKRAKRKTVGRFGYVETCIKSSRWRWFTGWCRVNIVNPRVPFSQQQTRSKRHWAAQRSQLGDMVRRVVEANCYAALREPQMKRVVRLLKEELRRGRHPMRLRELLQNREGSGDTLLFDLVAKKVELVPGPGAKLPLCVTQSEIAERFKEGRRKRIQWMAGQTGEFQSAPPSANAPAPPSATPPITFVTASQAPHKAPRTRVTHQIVSAPSDQTLTAAVSRFLDRVERFCWKDVVNWAIEINSRERGLPVKTSPTEALNQVVEACEPEGHDYTLTLYQDHVNFYQEWLLNWLRAYRSAPSEIQQILRDGYHLAVERSPLPTNAT
jgi:hypothetical protein